MTEVDMNWFSYMDIGDVDTSDMSEEKMDEIIDRALKYEEVEEWCDDLDEFHIVGGLKKKGWTFNDVDFIVNNERNDPWECDCYEQISELSKPPEWDVKIKGKCTGCGADIKWNWDEEKWIWNWSPNSEKRSVGKIKDIDSSKIQVSIDDIRDLNQRVKKIEKEVFDDGS